MASIARSVYPPSLAASILELNSVDLGGRTPQVMPDLPRCGQRVMPPPPSSALWLTPPPGPQHTHTHLTTTTSICRIFKRVRNAALPATTLYDQ